MLILMYGMNALRLLRGAMFGWNANNPVVAANIQICVCCTCNRFLFCLAEFKYPCRISGERWWCFSFYTKKTRVYSSWEVDRDVCGRNIFLFLFFLVYVNLVCEITDFVAMFGWKAKNPVATNFNLCVTHENFLFCLFWVLYDFGFGAV